MRNNLFLILLSLTSAFYVGCKDNTSTNCETCIPIKPSGDFSLQFSEKTIPFDVYYSVDDVEKERNALSISQNRLKEDEMNAVISSLGVADYVAKNKLNLVGLGYFTENTGKLDSKLPEITSSLGCILYHEKNEILETRLFLKNESGQVESIQSLELKVKFLTSNDLHEVSRYLSDKYKVRVHSLLMIRENSLPEIYKRGKIFSEEFQKHYPSSKLGKRQNKICGAPCPVIQDREWCLAQESQGGGESWKCYHDINKDCPKEEAEKQLFAAGLLNVAGSIDDVILYDFRDSFLVKSDKGRKYINDFYDLGTTLVQTGISIEMAQDGFNLGSNTIVPLLHTILQDPASSNPLYGITERDAIIAYLNELKTVSGDPAFQQILDDVIADINAYTNQSVSYIVNDFGN
jgi:hypothetical protein